MRKFHIDRGDGGGADTLTHTGGAHLHAHFLQFLALAGTALLANQGAKKADKTAAAAQNRSLDLEERNVALAEKQDARAGQLYGDYRTTFEPRQRQLVASAFDDDTTSPEAAAARATADVRKATGNAMQIRDRNARRLGVDPTSGAYAATDRDIDVSTAGLEASERGFARREARDSNFGRQSSVLGQGAGLPGVAGNLTNSAAGILGGVNASATRRLERAQELSGSAGQAFGNAVAGIGSLFGSWKGMSGGSTNPASFPVGQDAV